MGLGGGRGEEKGGHLKGEIPEDFMGVRHSDGRMGIQTGICRIPKLWQSRMGRGGCPGVREGRPGCGVFLKVPLMSDPPGFL